MSRTEIAHQIRDAVAAVVKQPEFVKWLKAEKIGEGLILLNNSLIFRQKLKTTKSDLYLGIPARTASHLGVSNVVVVHGITFNTDFKFVELKGMKKLQTDEIHTAIEKEMGRLGSIVTSIVKFSGVQATTVKLTGTTFLTATVPVGALTGSVTVTTGSTTLTSNKKFRVTPQIKSFTPEDGPVGTVVTVTGVGLKQTSEVTFDGVKATAFTVDSDTQVKATVPTGAKTGKIAVTTPGGTATSATSFAVTT